MSAPEDRPAPRCVPGRSFGAVGGLAALVAGCGPAEGPPRPGPSDTETAVLLIVFGVLTFGALVPVVVALWRAGRRSLLGLAIASWVILLVHLVGTMILVASAPGSAGALPVYARAVVGMTVVPVSAAVLVTSLALVHDVSRRPRRWITPVAVLLVGGAHAAGVVAFILAHAPLAVLSQAPMVQVVVGAEHGCALHQDGFVTCWGGNDDGQLGDGSLREVQWPVAVWGMYDAVSIAVGTGHTCVRRRNGAVACWGRDPATGEVSAVPVEIATGVIDGPWLAGSRVFAIDGSGLVVSGRGALEPLVPLPPAEQLAAGLRHVCTLMGDAQVTCWGDGARGQLAEPLTFGREAPSEESDEERLDLRARVIVSGLTGSTQVVSGHHHTCALRADGTVACWGSRDEGEHACRDGCRTAGPTPVAGLLDVAMLSAGAQHTCALTGSGGVACWGDNRWGQLGDGSFTSRDEAVDVALPGPAHGVFASAFSSCALLPRGEVWCWGASRYGSLGVEALKSCRAREIMPANECAPSPQPLRWAQRRE